VQGAFDTIQVDRGGVRGVQNYGPTGGDITVDVGVNVNTTSGFIRNGAGPGKDFEDVPIRYSSALRQSVQSLQRAGTLNPPRNREISHILVEFAHHVPSLVMLFGSLHVQPPDGHVDASVGTIVYLQCTRMLIKAWVHDMSVRTANVSISGATCSHATTVSGDIHLSRCVRAISTQGSITIDGRLQQARVRASAPPPPPAAAAAAVARGRPVPAPVGTRLGR
jgi:hypothetical protein